MLSHKPEVLQMIEKKIIFFQEMIQKTILHVQKIKMFDLLSISEVAKCIGSLHDLVKKLKDIVNEKNTTSTDTLLTKLQVVNNELSSILKIYGTESLDDMITICFGGSTNILCEEPDKFSLLKKYFHPINYSVIQIKSNDTELLSQITPAKSIYCQEISQTVKEFHLKVYGIRIILYNSNLKKTLSIIGIVDDVIIDFLDNSYINLCKNKIQQNLPKDDMFQNDIFPRFLSSLSLKDHLINNNTDIYCKYTGYMNQVHVIKQKTMQQIVKEYISNDLFMKRLTLIQLLIYSASCENQYLAYLLYDILSNDVNGTVDTQEQTILFDSFPWSIQQYFRDAMKKTVQYTNSLTDYDVNKIPMEQQICLLNAPENVKEKAMNKLKEMKSKSEDSGSKAQQYLKGLMKIPFRIYRKEKILTIMDEIRAEFKEYIAQNPNPNPNTTLVKKDKYTSLDIIKCIHDFYKCANDNSNTHSNNTHSNNTHSKTQLIEQIKQINDLIKKNKISHPKIKFSNKNITELTSDIQNFKILHEETYNKIVNVNTDNQSKVSPICTSFANIEHNFTTITNYMQNVKKILDKSVYGHDKPKKQIERIIGQWINGEQDGYCFGFEGPPGVGKTSLAKQGLSNCLLDEHGESRPFAMIQMGGDSNGSTLHGHNYTYVGSTWGSIVQIIIDKKCMNPIIFIDELDKICKTENGREIVGILIHLLDPAQNDCFQDKYFSGIDIDLSKALFVLSYNDPDAIDRILLDRIHRVKFINLSLDEKLTISQEYLLPDIYKKMGLENMILLETNVLKYIIDEYTAEPGVRKLKEILFEIVGEINLDTLTNKTTSYVDMEYPMKISIEDIKTKYFKDKQEIKHKQIHQEASVGIINGLWANALGFGGVIPIQAKYYPSDKFMDLKLTGMQGDVMKESMNVAQTLAWDLTPVEKKKLICKLSKMSIHIHCPEGAVPKDGPSAGTAITCVMYSLLNEIKIKNNIAITGEISLDGSITEIGGLNVKIQGGLKAGVKEFIFPEENIKDFNTFMEKHKDTALVEGIQFHPVGHISQVFKLIFI